jgi:hypothetical protein
MILNIHSDASYLSEGEAKSRAGGFFTMGSNIDSKNKLTNGANLDHHYGSQTRDVISSRSRNRISVSVRQLF